MESLEEEKNLTDPDCVKENKMHQTTITPRQSSKSDNHEKFVMNNKDIKSLQIIEAVPEDNDSFDGSDKETDDAVLFSEDEGLNDKYPDSSSSDEELLTKVSKLFYELFYTQLKITIISSKLFY